MGLITTFYGVNRYNNLMAFIFTRNLGNITMMSVSFISTVDILGTFSFAVAGAFAAMEKRLDPFGVLIISFVSAIGGGTIRDILLGNFPVSWLTETTAVLVILISCALALFFGTTLKKLDSVLFLFDAVGLGLFTMIGIQKGMDHGLHKGICIMLGTITGCFGGVLRDVLLNKVPLIFQKEIYASACIAGGILFFILLQFKIQINFSFIAGIVFTFLVRILAVRFNWSLPVFYTKK